MPAYKDPKKGTWMVKFRYTDWQGNRKETTRRGFATKREAKDFEDEYIRKIQGNANMTLESLYDIYIADRKQHIKQSSIIGIESTSNKYVLPKLGKLTLSEITPNVIRKWQNDLSKAKFKGNPLRPSTLLNINRNLSTLLNFAVKFYGLARNPMLTTGSTGKLDKRLDFWSTDEFNDFIASYRLR